MKRVKQRARGAYIFAALIVLGLGAYIFRYVSDGDAWAKSRVNQGIYSGGFLKSVTVLDRNGTALAASSDGVFYYADDPAVRAASLHAVGDFSGNIGTGALTAFAGELLGYSPITGLYSRSGGSGSLSLTVDSALQRAAYEALWGRNGAVLVMNYKSGEILCMVSSPGYDPVSPPDLTAPQYDGAYINRALSSAFTPGSVFKIVTLAAAIEEIPDLFIRTFTCTGSAIIDGREVQCSGVHGEQDIDLAFANSCNPAFARLAVELGGDSLRRRASSLGLLSGHDVDGVPTAAGSLTAGEDGSAELAWAGVGQGEDLVNPYALLRVCAAIAGGGEAPAGHLILDKSGSGASARLMSAGTAARLNEMMQGNIALSYGQGSFPGLKIGAKTGTAEVGGGSPHAWLAGFLDDSEHPLAFVVLVENGGGGLAAAGPVANAVLQAAVK